MAKRFAARRMAAQTEAIGIPQIVSAGYDSPKKSIGLNEHIHRGMELVYLMRGRTSWRLPDKTMTLAGGQCSLMQPFVKHQGDMDIIEPCTLFWIVFDLSVPGYTGGISRSDAASLRRTFTAAGTLVFDITDMLHTAFIALYDALLALAVKDRHAGMMLRSSLLAVLCQSARALQNPARRSTADLDRALSYIRANYRKKMSVRELSDISHLSESTFHEHFAIAFGISPMDYVVRERIHHSKAMLAGRSPVTDIALELGFASSQHFATAFRRFTGTTPSLFRSRSRRAL
ncbi:MAG: AraC family transcriptional regulator [Spirochaetota bacterium]